MKVVVDFDLCESNAVCMGIAPEVFEVRDDDFLYVLQEEPPPELHEVAHVLVALLPEHADQRLMKRDAARHSRAHHRLEREQKVPTGKRRPDPLGCT